MGVVFVREDLFMENCYWSMMPANFDFIKRKSYLPFNRIGGFASLHNFTTGKMKDNFWGNAVTAVPTRTDMPYFFNFHVENNGHTLIVGSDKNERAALTNFLISQAQKFDVKTIFVETDKGSEAFVKALGGKYVNENDFGNTIIENEIRTIGVNLNVDDTNKFTNLIASIESILNVDSPTIIFIGEQFSKTNDTGLRTILEEFAERIITKNALLIFATDAAGTLDNNGIFKEKLLNLIKTKIFMPNPKANFDFKEAFALKEAEYRQIKKLSAEDGEFLIKRSGDAVVVKFNFKGNKHMPLLISNANEVQLIEKAIAETGGDEPEKWLSNYYKLTAK
jgi:type IV secretory pathway VirB4 component